MAQLSGVNIEKLQGGLLRGTAGTDNHVAYIVEMPEGVESTAVNNNGKGVVLKSAYDAQLLDINTAYDSNNNMKLYNQILEFFRLAPEATLYLFNSTTVADIQSFINNNKDIKGYGINIAYDDVEPNLTSTISAHQIMINELASQNRLIDFAMIGFDGLNTFDTDLFTMEAPQISVCVACEDNSGLVSVGSALGMIAVRKISENMGSVDIENKPRDKRGTENYTLTDPLFDRWLNAYITSGETVSSLDKGILKDMLDKGYIIVASYEGYAGFYFENSYTCIDRASDYAFIENNRVWNHAARTVRNTLLPRVKSKVKKDPVTGFIATTTVSYWTGLVNKALEQMIVNDDISGFEVNIDPSQVVNSTSPVRVQAMVVADGIVHEFEVAVGLTNNI